MSEEDLKGKPWKVVGKFKTFKEADAERKTFLNEENLQVKINKLSDLNDQPFVVKTRSTIVAPPKNKKGKK